MNPALLINIIQSLVVDKAQSLAVEHVTKAIDDNLNDNQKKLLDAVVEEMPDNSFKSIILTYSFYKNCINNKNYNYIKYTNKNDYI